MYKGGQWRWVQGILSYWIIEIKKIVALGKPIAEFKWEESILRIPPYIVYVIFNTGSIPVRKQ